MTHPDQPKPKLTDMDETQAQAATDAFRASLSKEPKRERQPKPSAFPQRVFIRIEPWHESALNRGEVFSTDVANHYARRGSHWIEHLNIEEHEAALAAKKCERCGDLFYHPKTLIEDQSQRAAEWEDIAKRAESRLEIARKALEAISKHEFTKLYEVTDFAASKLKEIL